MTLVMVRKSVVLFLALCFVASCGKKNPPKEAENSGDEADAGETATDDSPPTPKGSSSADPITGEKPADKKSCEGLEVDLLSVLSQASCEAQKPTKDVDMKGKLEVSVRAIPNVIPKGGKATISIAFANKGKEPLPLYFTVDPEPRFQIEVYDKKTNKRVDEPAGAAPSLPDSVAQAQVPEAKTARATLVIAGNGFVKLDWEAVKYKWAPADKAKGAIPGRGYPKVAAGPLPKGKYVVKVLMPMVGIFEGLNREISVVQADVEIQ